MEENKLRSVIESLLFSVGEPIKILRLAKIVGHSKAEVETELDNLNEHYLKGSGLRIIMKGESVQMVTNPENSTFVSQLVSGELKSELSRSALETLAIIAYKGPVTRPQIEAIRGVNCTYVIRSLMIRGLIERKEGKDIRGYIYEITFDFLKIMGITKAEELPEWQELRNNDKVEQLLNEANNDNIRV